MKPPAFQFYARDWLSSTLGMPWDVKGAYIDLLAWSWDNGPLPDDGRWRARMLGKDFHSPLWKSLKSRWKLTENGWINPRLEAQRAAVATYQKRAQTAASARWSIHQASAQAVLDRSTASPSPSADLNTPAAERPVRTKPEFKIYAAIASRVLEHTAGLDLDAGAQAEELKRACAKEGLEYDATLIRKSIDAAKAARTKRRA